MGIMLGSRVKQRKERQTGIGVREKVKIVSEVPSFAGRIPTDITVRLRIVAVAGAISDTVFPAFTGMVRTETGSSNDGSTVAGHMDPVRVNLSFANGFFQKAGTKDSRQGTDPRRA